MKRRERKKRQRKTKETQKETQGRELLHQPIGMVQGQRRCAVVELQSRRLTSVAGPYHIAVAVVRRASLCIFILATVLVLLVVVDCAGSRRS